MASARPSERAIENKGNVNAFLNKSRQLSLSVSKRCSSKIKEIIKLVKNNRGPTIIYSFFVENGVNVIHKCLKNAGIDEKKMMKVTSQVSAAKRKDWMKKFNSGQIDVVLISKSGSEGINFSGARNVIIASPDWNMANVQQAVGRATRLTSKVKTVKVFIMLAVDDVLERSTDEHIWNFAQNKQNLIDQFDKLLSANSIDLKNNEVKTLIREQKFVEQEEIKEAKESKGKPKSSKKKSPSKTKTRSRRRRSVSKSPRSRRRSRSPKKKRKRKRSPRSECSKKSIQECDRSEGCSVRVGYCRRKKGAPKNIKCGGKSPRNCRNSKWCTSVKAGCRKTRPGKADVSSDDVPLTSLYY